MVTGFELDDGASPAWKVKVTQTLARRAFNGYRTENNALRQVAPLASVPCGPTSKVVGTWQGSFYDDAVNCYQTDTGHATRARLFNGTFDAVVANASLLPARSVQPSSSHVLPGTGISLREILIL